MAQPHPGDMLHYRLFATLIMAITLLLGLGIGYFAGVSVGQQTAIQLLYKGQEAEAVAVQSKAETTAKSNAALAKCYEETLGVERYQKWTAGEGLTVEEVFKVLPCESLKTQ